MYNVIRSYCTSTAQSPITCNCTYPKLCTDHPVLVYKTYKFRWTVLRLFSCQSPHWSLLKLPHRQQLALRLPQSTPSRLFSPFVSSFLTSPCCSFGSVTFNSALSSSLATYKVVSSRHWWQPPLACLCSLWQPFAWEKSLCIQHQGYPPQYPVLKRDQARLAVHLAVPQQGGEANFRAMEGSKGHWVRDF